MSEQPDFSDLVVKIEFTNSPVGQDDSCEMSQEILSSIVHMAEMHYRFIKQQEGSLPQNDREGLEWAVWLNARLRSWRVTPNMR